MIGRLAAIEGQKQVDFKRLNLLLAISLASLLTTPVSSLRAQNEEWGHFQGRIIVDGEIPSPDALTIGENREYCGRHDLKDESLQVGEEGGLSNVFVYLYQPRRGEQQEPAIHPSYSGDAEESRVLDNLNCRFEPHVMAIRTEQPLVLKNSDEIGHNAYVQAREKPVNELIPAGAEIRVALDIPFRGPAKVTCGSHSWMSAYVLAREEPYFAITDSKGQFEIRNLPAGEWTFQFWHERSGLMTTLSQEGEKVVGQRAEMKIEIFADRSNDIGALSIGASDLED